MRNNERIIEALEIIIEELKKDTCTCNPAPAESPVVDDKKPEPTTAEEPMNEPEEPANSEEAGAYTKEQLDAMKYNELKKLGASLGVACTGKRDEITARILSVVSAGGDDTAESASEPEEEKVVQTQPRRGGGLKKKAQSTEPEIAPEFVEAAKELLESNAIEDIKDALKDVGVKVKRTDNLETVLAKALADGLLETEDDEEDDKAGEDQTEEAGDDEIEFSEDSYFSQYDPEGVNDPANMSKKRLKAVKAMMASIIEGVETEEITEDDISTFLETMCTEDELESLGENYTFEELVAMYCEVNKRLIDNDGDTHEASDPYELGEENFCCGHKLKYDRKSKKYICETCGEEYEE